MGEVLTMPNIAILPESNDETLCVRMSNLVDSLDYDQFFHQEIVRRKNENGIFNLLVWYDDTFVGWTPDGADANFKSITMMGPYSGRVAYVNADENKIFLMKMTKPIISGEIRYFNEDELTKALVWVLDGATEKQ